MAEDDPVPRSRVRTWVGERLAGRRARAILVALGLFGVLEALPRVLPRRPLRDQVSSSTAVYDAHHRLLRLTLSDDEKYRMWVPLQSVSPLLVQATLLYEDRQFYRHYAVNPWSLARAAASTFFGGGRRIGGSTITMQLARRIYGVPSHTVLGKLRQIARALQLELLYSKDEILEAYLNLSPYGLNVEGAEAAAQIYFGKPASRLTLPEALTLAVIPQSPTKRAPSRGNNPILVAAAAALQDAWRGAHPNDAAAARREDGAAAAPPAMQMPSELPFLAPHFVEEVLPARTGEHQIETTLDLGLQRLMERRLRGYVARKRRLGINNAVAMLVDTRDLSVKALVGSADYYRAEIFGQVNGAQARRSPGSTLKPFVYALGLEQGVIHPETMLKDAPVSFGPYSPENFDGRFIGPVSARDALVRSRNIPALSVASRLAKPNLYDFLRMSGVAKLRAESHYGLSLALGGGEVTMEELCAMYAALGNHGLLRPLRFRKSDPILVGEAGTRVLSDEASYVTLDMLEDNPRPDKLPIEGDGRGLRVAWKTGTSYGFRDAWSVGLFGPYVLAVWVGNFSGEGNPALVGVQAAAPLFFEIVDAIAGQDKSLVQPERPPPKGLSRVSVCALSGQIPGPHCAHQKHTWFLPGRSPIEACRIHRELVLFDGNGHQACPPFTGPTHREVYEVWPSDLLELFRVAGIPRRAPPPADGNCAASTSTAGGLPPQITSPARGLVYAPQKGADPAMPERQERLALSATTDGDVQELYWFVDDVFVGKAKRGQTLLYAPRPGRYTVRAVDDLGRADSRDLRVE